MLGIGGSESYVIKQSGLRIQRDHTLDIERVSLANAVKGRVLIVTSLSFTFSLTYNGQFGSVWWFVTTYNRSDEPNRFLTANRTLLELYLNIYTLFCFYL
jgi:hypothetical protein